MTDIPNSRKDSVRSVRKYEPMKVESFSNRPIKKFVESFKLRKVRQTPAKISQNRRYGLSTNQMARNHHPSRQDFGEIPLSLT